MQGKFSAWIEQLKGFLSTDQRSLPDGDLSIQCLDWFTEGLTPEEAAREVIKFADAKLALA
jgi:hypothetical protein